MWNRLALTFEIIGYGRAIGALSREPNFPKSGLDSLIQDRDKAVEKLRKLRALRTKRFLQAGATA